MGTSPPRPGDPLLVLGELLDREVALGELLTGVVRRIAQAMRADRGTLYLLDRAREELFSKAADLPELSEIRLALGQGVAGHVAQTGETLNVPTTNADPRFFSGIDARTGYETRSILAVPLRDSQGDLIGVVQLLNKQGGPFTRDDEMTLTALAEQAAAAVEATTLYDALFRGEAAPAGVAQGKVDSRFNRIIGESAVMQRAYDLTTRAARSEATVLIHGESGTGKELFARAVHVNSRRSEGPFVKVDCAALPESLIENELFGHEKGAYTGADARAEGKFDAAAGGTLFLDEIGELPLSAQSKLLRVLQDHTFLRVGGTEQVEADVRVVTATNRDLEQMVKEGRFRSDLYYRVRVVDILLPPLRERGEADLRRLVLHFIQSTARRHGREVPALSEGAWSRLLSYRWPGNVRELEHCIESAVVICDETVIQPADLPLPDRGAERSRAGEPGALELGPAATLEEVEREHIRRVLESVDGNRSEAARSLGIGRSTLLRKIARYGL
ncbi:MAG: sigma 54-interacting transcriptional regulator [Deltaproteobacteria bacterium]|nr:sigma 54-interacting transcriptional regulator [Deltaproteobacteria bacterium]